MTDGSWGPGVLDRFRREREVRIETSAGPGAPIHEAVIWIVVDEADRVLVRSVRGERGRWYRELRRHPVGAVVAAEARARVRAVPASDPDRVEACSRALRAKYARARASLASMLVDETLPTTLELLPA